MGHASVLTLCMLPMLHCRCFMFSFSSSLPQFLGGWPPQVHLLWSPTLVFPSGVLLSVLHLTLSAIVYFMHLFLASSFCILWLELMFWACIWFEPVFYILILIFYWVHLALYIYILGVYSFRVYTWTFSLCLCDFLCRFQNMCDAFWACLAFCFCICCLILYCYLS